MASSGSSAERQERDQSRGTFSILAQRQRFRFGRLSPDKPEPLFLTGRPPPARTSVQDPGGHPGQAGRMRFDTKIAIAVQESLAAWQKLNVTAFLASAVAGGVPGVIGERYEDGSGHTYLPMFRQPVLVYAADAQALARV